MLTLIMAYYNQPVMLGKQIHAWCSYDIDVRKSIRIIIVDDCSDIAARDHLFFPMYLKGSLYWLKEKRAWNCAACRNLAAREAETRWLLLTDLDHIVPVETMRKVLEDLPGLDEKTVYRFQRINKSEIINPHGNSFLMTKDMYWTIGGYDERLAGLYYGTAGNYRKRLNKHPVKVLDYPLILYGNDEIEDAEVTIPKPPKDMREIRRRTEKGKIKILSFGYEVQEKA